MTNLRLVTPTADEVAADELEQFRPIRRSQLFTRPRPKSLIEGILSENTVLAMYGPPACGKSHFTLGAMYHLAMGRPFLGQRVTQQKVLYTAAEGADGYIARAQAWEYHMSDGRGFNHDEIATVEENLQYLTRELPLGDVRAINTFIKAINSFYPDCQGLVLDTVFRCSTGLDLNTHKDMSRLVDAVHFIKRETNLNFIWLVHHSGKDKERGMTGSMALLAGCDTVFRVEKNADLSMNISSRGEKGGKMKDGMETEYSTTLKTVWYGDEPDDSSCVVVLNDGSESQAAPRKEVSAKEKMIALLPAEGLTNTEWKNAFVADGGSINTFNAELRFLKSGFFVYQDGKVYKRGKGLHSSQNLPCRDCSSQSWAKDTQRGCFVCLECHPNYLSQNVLSE